MDAAKRDAEIRRLTGDVRYAGVNQVWGHMCKGWENEYSHENWRDEMSYQWFKKSLVPWTFPADDRRDIVLVVDECLSLNIVDMMYEFLLSLMKWWTSPAKFASHEEYPKYTRMMYVICLWEHEVQNNFDVSDVYIAVRTCNEIIRILENTADETLKARRILAGLLTRLRELSSFLSELATFLDATEERVAPSVPEVGSSAGIHNSLLRLKSQCHVLDKSSI
jgi:hypothetical protein